MNHSIYLIILLTQLNLKSAYSSELIQLSETRNYLVLVEVEEKKNGYHNSVLIYMDSVDLDSAFEGFNSDFFSDDLTKNLGYAVDVDPLYFMYCCEFGDIEKGLLSSLKFGIDSSSEKKYDSLSTVNNMFPKSKHKEFQFVKESKKYKIYVWKVRISYCKCKPFMMTFKQKMNTDFVLYIKEEVDYFKMDTNDVIFFQKIVAKFNGE